MKKVGSTAVFGDAGARVPVTLLLLEDTFVVDVKSRDVHGYNAVVLGVRRPGRLNKPQVCALRKKGVDVDCHLFESRVDTVDGVELGGKVLVDHFFRGQFVDVAGRSIGRGFAGVMKRHNFGGLHASHGVSISHRSQGSTGSAKIPLSAEVFGVQLRRDVLRDVVAWQLAKRRAGTHKTRCISDVSGTTAKPYRQKHTGRARQGSLRSPQFRGVQWCLARE
ncbi:hypothetical protein GH714_042829 [Hevea brasiliensis]|uniref:Large ribosomal subunit protein uL3c n=1 Tax=Hevea brasiliensis TaxID=3981 RepID=A0A6A6K0M2_HEVBR|nr:hypothetical protein GH714_042829 [Hevea brasiliensis]